MATEGLTRLITDAHADSGLRARMMYFPEETIAPYELSSEEREAVLARDVHRLELPSDLAPLAREVFDLSGP